MGHWSHFSRDVGAKPYLLQLREGCEVLLCSWYQWELGGQLILGCL